jgi:ankyrin repeat protein
LNFLVEDAGVHSKVKARQAKTPLWLAASNKHMEVFEFLVSLDADPEAADLTGVTPWAAMFASEQS